MKSIQNIIERVNVRYEELGESFNINQLRSIIRDQETPIEDIEIPDVPGEMYPYSRKIITSTEIVEITVLRWNINGQSMIHDYGESYGIVRVLSGHLNFTLFNSELNEIGQGSVPAIDTFDLPGKLIHKMYNPSNYQETISLHFYCPKLNGINIYLPDENRKIALKGGIGAWYPQTSDIISEGKLHSS